MGIFYSHIVFQPPSPPSYSDDNATISFRKARHGNNNNNRPSFDSADPDNISAPDTDQYITHPIFYLKTANGNTLPAAYFPQPGSYYTILFSHGNGEDLGVTASYALQLSTFLRTNVLCYDYSGYGLATGKPTESNVYADIRAAYTHLISEQRIPPQRIVLFGRSLGSGPTVDLAAELGANLAGVVLIAALTSCVRVVFSNAPHTAKFDMFANIDKMPKIRVPVFCVHGMVDDVVPFSHGLQLARRAKYPLKPLWIRSAGHNNLESSRFQYEVFLRYMKVLQEFRRWKPPKDADLDEKPNAKRHESVGALVKVAGCFGRGEEDAHAKTASGRTRGKRRATRTPSSSSGHLFLRRRFSHNSNHETDLKMLWTSSVAAEDGSQSVLTRRSSDATFGSRSVFDDGESSRPQAGSGSGASLSSSSIPKIAAVV